MSPSPPHNKEEEEEEDRGDNNVHFDHVLDQFVGSSGSWQWRQFVFLLLQAFCSSIPLMIHIFGAFTPAHRCRVDICDAGGLDGAVDQNWTEFAIPPNDAMESFLKRDQEMSKCQMYQVRRDGTGVCSEDSFNTSSRVPCTEYVYDRSVFEETITTELDLVCRDSYKPRLIGTILMVGMTAGCLIGGPLGDKFGRRRTVVAAVSMLAPTVVVEGLIPYYEAYAVFRLAVFTCISVMWVASHTLLMELFGQYHRKVAYTLSSICFSVSGTMLPLVAYFERDWKYLHLWIGLMVLVLVPILYLFLKESMRWLVLNGREEEAEEMLLDVARVNGRHLSDTQCRRMREALKCMAASARESHESQLTILDMFKEAYMVTTLIALTVWISSVVAFYTLMLNVGSLAGDMFWNYVISSLVDVPATIYILVAIDAIGRRFCIIITQVMLGLCCICMAFIPKDQSTVIMVLFLLGRFSATCSLNTAWFYTAELFPTNLRAQAVGTCSLVARVFGTSASFIASLSVYWEPLSMLALGVPALISGALVFNLPETRGKELKEMAREEMVRAVVVDDGGDEDKKTDMKM